PDAPQWPGSVQLQDALGHWRDWPVLTPALRRSLAHMEEPDQWALMEDLRAGGGDVFLYTQTGAPDVVRVVSAWPLPPELRPGLVEESGEDVLALTERAAASLVLGRLAEAGEAERAKPVQRRLRKVGKLLEKLDEEERRLKAMTSRQEDALALSANLWRWQPDARAEWVEVPDETGGDGEPRRIRLDARHDIRANMERLFHAAKRGKRGLEMLEPRRAALLEEAEGLRQALGDGGEALPAAAGEGATAPAAPVAARILPRELPKRVQAFVSDDDFLLLRGRDARGNQAVLRKAAPGDIWLHAEGGPGAHVLIRRAHAGQEVPERTLEQAGCLAASKSWRRDAASARILYAEARHVRPLRGAAPGTVRMDKILATREVAVDPELENRLVHS
ncbi:MAG: NFACT RNA binding domain-containing protein, partial [Desulfovibrio sp.]|nr:NFACT RNA binding domain-containing protein [Desulfovibrio sp.]